MNKFLNLNLDIIQKSKVKSQNDKSKFKMNFIENFTFYNVILRFAFFSILNIRYLILYHIANSADVKLKVLVAN